MKRRTILITWILGFALLLAGCQSQESPLANEEPLQRTNFVLGTVVTVTLFDNGSEAILDKVFDRLLAIENLMSANLDASEIGQINLSAGKNPVQVSEETFTVIKQGMAYGDLSKGYFDISMDQLWACGKSEQVKPKCQKQLF